MKEKILAMLKTKYKHLGLSAKILELKAAQLAKKVEKEEDIETAVDGVDEELQMIQSLNDSHRTEMSNLRKELKPEAKGADEEKKDPPANPDPQKTETDTQNPELKALLAGFSELKTLVQSFQAEKTVNSRKSVFESKLNEIKGLPESDKALRIQLMEALKHESEEDFNSWMEDQVKTAGEIAQAAPQQEGGRMPLPISGNGGTQKSSLSDQDVEGMLGRIM